MTGEMAMKKNAAQLRDLVVIVTGAAGGIGRAVARLFAHNGAILVLTDIHRQGLESLEESLQAEGHRVMAVVHDVSDPGSWQALVDRVMETFGRVDVLINNAGVVQPGPAEDLPLDKVLQQVSVNLLGTIHGCQAALRVMKAQGFGKIVNLASLGGIVPMPGEAVYCATKNAIRGYTFSVYAELLDSPVGITAVCPDSVETPQLDYELLHDEALLSFIGEPLKTEQAARGILKAVLRDSPEILIPSGMGIAARTGMAFPRIFFILCPWLKRIGRATMKKRREEVKENVLFNLDRNEFSDLKQIR